MESSSTLVAVLGIVALVVFLVIFVITRIRVAGPNEAFIITGRKGKGGGGDTSGQKVVMGASVFVVPFVQKLGVIDLTSRQIGISVPAAVALNGIRGSLEGVAVVKVGGTEELIRAAAQRFLGQQTDIDVFTREVLAGSLRAIVGRLTVEEIIRDRAAFAAAVAEEAENSLTGQGLVLDTFQLQDIQTEGNYLADLGRPEAARAEKEAAIAEAIARRESEQARILAEEEIAVAHRELALKQAEIKAQTDAAAANAAASGPMAQAAKDQEVLAAQEHVAARRAELTERDLDSQVRKPADAQRYAVEQAAAADKARDIAYAQAQAETTRLSGAAEQERRTALAEATKAEGVAEAAAIAARGEAEAGAMQRKAEAYKHYGEAAVVDIIANTLPQVVAEAAAPMSNIDQMTVISTDGASQTVRSVASTVAQGSEMVKALFGVDLTELVQGFAESRNGGNGGNGHADPPASIDATSADGTPSPS
jgi:flotillin